MYIQAPFEELIPKPDLDRGPYIIVLPLCVSPENCQEEEFYLQDKLCLLLQSLFSFPIRSRKSGVLPTSSRHPAAPIWPPLWKCSDLKHTQTIHYYRYGMTNMLLQENTGTPCPTLLYNTEWKRWRSGSHATYYTRAVQGFFVVVVGTTEKSAVLKAT